MAYEERIEVALATIDAFASIGVRRFCLTATDLTGEKVYGGYWARRNMGAMQLLIPHLVPRCWQLQQNLIVRPLAPAGVVLAQLDDIDASRRDEIAPYAFLVVRTSPAGYQVWTAIAGAEAGFVSRLVKGIGADCSARGAGCLPGSPNCKPKYKPDFPAVQAFLLQPGRIVAAGELEKFLAPPVQFAPPRVSSGGGDSRGWPSYPWVLRGAPRKRDGTHDRSKANFFWSKLAIERGNSQQAVVAKLAQVSERAQGEIRRGNANYLQLTVANAVRGSKGHQCAAIR